MTPRFYDRASRAFFWLAFAALMTVIFLDYVIPHLEGYWKELRQPMSAWQMSLIRASKITQDFWFASVTLGLFLASIVCRVVAASALRGSPRPRGFDVTTTNSAE